MKTIADLKKAVLAAIDEAAAERKWTGQKSLATETEDGEVVGSIMEEAINDVLDELDAELSE